MLDTLLMSLTSPTAVVTAISAAVVYAIAVRRVRVTPVLAISMACPDAALFASSIVARRCVTLSLALSLCSATTLLIAYGLLQKACITLALAVFALAASLKRTGVALRGRVDAAVAPVLIASAANALLYTQACVECLRGIAEEFSSIYWGVAYGKFVIRYLMAVEGCACWVVPDPLTLQAILYIALAAVVSGSEPVRKCFVRGAVAALTWSLSIALVPLITDLKTALAMAGLVLYATDIPYYILAVSNPLLHTAVASCRRIREIANIVVARALASAVTYLVISLQLPSL